MCRELEERLRALEGQVAELRVETAELAAKNARLKERVRELEGERDAARRAGKRQETPFSKGEPAKEPRPPGRRPGDC